MKAKKEELENLYKLICQCLAAGMASTVERLQKKLYDEVNYKVANE
jgi:hypothetical protein